MTTKRHSKTTTYWERRRESWVNHVPLPGLRTGGYDGAAAPEAARRIRYALKTPSHQRGYPHHAHQAAER